MPGTSKTTKAVAFRLPNEVWAILERRLKGKRSKHLTINSYLKALIIYDATRKR